MSAIIFNIVSLTMRIEEKAEIPRLLKLNSILLPLNYSVTDNFYRNDL